MDNELRTKIRKKRTKRAIKPERYFLGVGLGILGWYFFYPELRKSSGLFAKAAELIGYGSYFRPQEALLPDSLLTLLCQLGAICIFAAVLYFLSRHETAHLLAYLIYHFRIIVIYLNYVKNDGVFSLLLSFLPSTIALSGTTVLIRGLKMKKYIISLMGILMVVGAFGLGFKMFSFIY